MSTLTNPFFSVIVPVYNRVHSVGRTIESVLRQSLERFELILVDDGSTDGTADLLKTYTDPRVIVIHQQNRGRSAARNAGARASSGTYLIFLDSDDEALPNWLELLAMGLSEDTPVNCCGLIEVSQKKESVRLPHNRGPMHKNQICLFQAGTFAVRKDIFDAIDGYEETLAFSENTELGIRLVERVLEAGLKIGSIDQPGIRYYRNDDRQSNKDCGALLNSAQFMLSRHGNRMRKTFPQGFANYSSIAGVNAARLGLTGVARRHFISAIACDPFRPAYYARLLVSLIAPLSRKF